MVRLAHKLPISLQLKDPNNSQLDYIGLLSTGNEEMLRFAWKTFSRWQMRTEGSDKEKKEKHETFRYMEQFRETFSRPIDSIRFIGLFDCVNRLVPTEHGIQCC